MLLQKMPLGYELVVTGFNPLAARYAGIDVARRLVLAAFFAGGLGALAGNGGSAWVAAPADGWNQRGAWVLWESLLPFSHD